MRLFLAATWMVVAGVIGCSGSGGTGTGGGGGGSEGNRYSCDVPNNGARVCQDTVYPDELSAIVEQAKSMCAPSGGTVGDTCDTTGAVGGCRTTDPDGAKGVITTFWYYLGTEAEIMAKCVDGSVFVKP